MSFSEKSLKPEDWPTHGAEYSSLWCSFGWHESALNCPPGTLAWHESVTDYGYDRRAYSCDNIVANYGRMGIHAAFAEWLFQNVSQLVIQKAQRQIREDFLSQPTVPTVGPKTHANNNNTFQRWLGIPDASSLIIVHPRWGDKDSEVVLYL